mmetsp:Transcript_18417/g.55085  ORF Transcript_18417/g.55085 Transcript_18417/m.55085 type:complete len:270 (-) Transcript_18417:262-1071(-)
MHSAQRGAGPSRPLVPSARWTLPTPRPICPPHRQRKNAIWLCIVTCALASRWPSSHYCHLRWSCTIDSAMPRRPLHGPQTNTTCHSQANYRQHIRALKRTPAGVVGVHRTTPVPRRTPHPGLDLPHAPTAPDQSHVTLARVGKLRLRRCAISTRTEFIVAPEPVIERQAVGWSPSASRETRSTVPPAILRNGRISSSTSSTPSSVSTGPSGCTCTTSLMSGIFSSRPRSRPIFIVIVLDGHEPHAPCSSSLTTLPSISRTATLPPSACR